MIDKKYGINPIDIFVCTLFSLPFFLIFTVGLYNGKTYYMFLLVGLYMLIWTFFYARNSYIQLSQEGIHFYVGAFSVDHQFIPYEKINSFELTGNILKDLKIYTGIEHPIVFKSIDQGSELIDGITHMMTPQKTI